MNTLSFLLSDPDPSDTAAITYHFRDPRRYNIVQSKPEHVYYTVVSEPPFGPLFVEDATDETAKWDDTFTPFWLIGQPPQLVETLVTTDLRSQLYASTTTLCPFVPYTEEDRDESPFSFAVFTEPSVADFDDRPLWQRRKDPFLSRPRNTSYQFFKGRGLI